MDEQMNQGQETSGATAGFMAARAQRANSAYVFSMRDGRLVWVFPGVGELALDPAKVSATNRARAMTFGLKQRVTDAAAIEAGPDGKVDPRAKYDEMKRMIEHLESGTEEWNLRAGTGGGTASYVTRALVALGTYQGRDVSTPDLANVFVRTVADAPKLALGGQVAKARTWLETNSALIRAKVAEIRAAETPVVDGDAEIARLFDE